MQLLVSVRSAEEALLASQNGADRIDLKEPSLGSLGATSPQVWQQVVETWHTTLEVSIALGELVDTPLAQHIPMATDSVKIGLAGCRDLPTWQDALAEFYETLPRNIARVAVYYADINSAVSPDFDSVLEAARRLECQTILIDTYNKTLGSVFEHLSPKQLLGLRQQVGRRGYRFALAGSLRFEHLTAVGRIRPDIVAVRGAVCHHDRTGQLDLDRLAAFRDALPRASGTRPAKILSPG